MRRPPLKLRLLDRVIQAEADEVAPLIRASGQVAARTSSAMVEAALPSPRAFRYPFGCRASAGSRVMASSAVRRESRSLLTCLCPTHSRLRPGTRASHEAAALSRTPLTLLCGLRGAPLPPADLPVKPAGPRSEPSSTAQPRNPDSLRSLVNTAHPNPDSDWTGMPGRLVDREIGRSRERRATHHARTASAVSPERAVSAVAANPEALVSVLMGCPAGRISAQGARASARLPRPGPVRPRPARPSSGNRADEPGRKAGSGSSRAPGWPDYGRELAVGVQAIGSRALRPWAEMARPLTEG